MGNGSALAGLLLLFGAVTASPAAAQPATVDGAYAKLSPGHAKIARALYEAQPTAPTSGSARPLTLDEIAAMKRSGQGWTKIFESMKARGLVRDKTLGQVVSRHQQSSASASYGDGGSSKTR
jgi:hypothetical protein